MLHGKSKMDRLEEIITDIELLVISVVQGLAVTTLADKAIMPLQNLDFQYWPYIATAFIFILVYWSQAMNHALSFIKWPLSIGHSSLYYLTAIIEFLAFAHITNPLQWFLYTSFFMIVIFFLYICDLGLLRRERATFEKSEEGTKLYKHSLKEQLFELKTFVPGAIVFNILATWLIYTYPGVLIDHYVHIALIGIQGLFALFVFLRSLGQFKTRTTLITKYYEKADEA